MNGDDGLCRSSAPTDLFFSSSKWHHAQINSIFFEFYPKTWGKFCVFVRNGNV